MNFDLSLRKYLYVLLGCFLGTLLGFFLIYKGLAVSLLVFGFYFILFIFFPTHFFSKKIIPLKLSRLESFVFGYVITEVFLFGLQWLFNFTGFKNGIWCFLIFTILGIKAFLENTEKKSTPESASLRLKLSWFYVAYILLYFIMYFFIEIPAFEPGRITSIYPDQLWNVGNTWSIVRGIFPTIDSRFAGQILGYHLIQSYLHATFTIVSGIPPLLIQNYYFSLVDAFFIIFTIGLAAKRFLNWSEKTIITILFALLFTKGLGWYYHGHLFADPLTFLHSLSAFFLFLTTMLSYFTNKDSKLFPLSIFAFCVMVGAKATLAMIFLPTLLVIFCYKLILKKDTPLILHKEFLLGIGLLIACLALKFMIFLNSRPILINHGGDYSSVFTLISHHFHSLPFWAINSIFLTYLIIKKSVFYFTNPQGILFFLGAGVLFSQNKFKKYFNNQAIFLLLSIGICIILENVLRYDGSDGEIYFSWYGKIIVIFLFGHLYQYFQDEQLQKRNYHFVSTFIFFIGFILFVIPFYENHPEQNWFKTDSRAHIGATLTFNELEGMKWLHDHVKDSEIIFSDRRSFPKEKMQPNGIIINRFFAYSALSGKQFFIEGDDFNCCEDLAKSRDNWNKVNQFLNSSNNNEQLNLLKIFNADYFIQSLRFNQKDFSGLSSLTLVYSNPDINIYKIKTN